MKKELPKNDRADDMWHFISSAHSFYKQTVIDYGCGYGDMLKNVVEGGAELAVGYEKDKKVFRDLRFKVGYSPRVQIWNLDFEQEDKIPDADVALCLSVLPYLNNPDKHLQIMARSYNTSFIECQYAGDGPGFARIKNDEGMAEWLKESGFPDPQIVGKTLAKEKWWRTIWMCDRIKSVQTYRPEIGKPSESS